MKADYIDAQKGEEYEGSVIHLDTTQLRGGRYRVFAGVFAFMKWVESKDCWELLVDVGDKLGKRIKVSST